MSIFLGLVAVSVGVWVWFALSVHAPVRLVLVTQGFAVAAVIGAIVLLYFGFVTEVAVGLAIAILACIIWYLTRRPRNDRNWIPETRHGVTATIGPEVTLHRMRRFRWASKHTFLEDWEDGVFDPETITEVDLYLSIWSNPRIAHTMAGFSFADGRRVVFSGETRRVQGDRFSITGGFFRRFELVLLATDERDAIHLRAEVRREKVFRYPVEMPDAAARALFVAYATLGNELAVKPRWYNTITANCTTVPYRLVKAVAKRVRFGWPVLLSGYLPEYLDRMGVLPHGTDRDRARVPVVGDAADYSAAIRGQRN
jgi:Domain of unknown function (DUF4105)